VFPGEAEGKPLQGMTPKSGNRFLAKVMRQEYPSSGSGKMCGRRPNCPPSVSTICATPSRRCLFRAA
jgi:hypothetical protein